MVWEYGVAHMLVDEDNANVLSLLDEAVERRLDCGRVRLVVDDEEVLLCIGTGRDVLHGALDSIFSSFHGFAATHANAREEQSSHRVLGSTSAVCRPHGRWKPSPSHLVADYGEELPVLEICMGGHPGVEMGRRLAIAWRAS